MIQLLPLSPEFIEMRAAPDATLLSRSELHYAEASHVLVPELPDVLDVRHAVGLPEAGLPRVIAAFVSAPRQ
jgi:hypothetical protein